MGCRYRPERQAPNSQCRKDLGSFRIEPDAYTISLIPSQTDDSAKATYRHVIEVASARASSVEVKAWGCNSEVNGTGLCKKWCRDPVICPASFDAAPTNASPAALTDDAIANAAHRIAQLLLGDVRKVDCDIIESHIRALLQGEK
ncbi:hypothetical protein [Cupriavidus basilensis]